MTTEQSHIPVRGPLSNLNAKNDWTEVVEKLYYNGASHLHRCFRIPINSLHFNVENGRYHTKFLLLKNANPKANIDPRKEVWRVQIHLLLSGRFEDPISGVNTRNEKQHFEDLVADMKVRGQERVGMVLEDGGVMSGNRRLAALMTLASESNDPKFQYFEAVIIPGHVDEADRWRLEISAQQGQSRLLEPYDPVEKLLKIKEGKELLMRQNPAGGEQAAIKGVALEFGMTTKEVSEELGTLNFVEQWLTAIGHPKQWWLANGLTEVFTEMTPLVEAMDTAGLQLKEKSELKRAVYGLIKNREATYGLLREVRSAVGPRTPRRNSPGGVPTAVDALKKNAPTVEGLREEITPKSRQRARSTRNTFTTEFQAKREEEEPIDKAKRAQSNLETVSEMVATDRPAGAVRETLRTSVTASKVAIEQILKDLGDRSPRNKVAKP